MQRSQHLVSNVHLQYIGPLSTQLSHTHTQLAEHDSMAACTAARQQAGRQSDLCSGQPGPLPGAARPGPLHVLHSWRPCPTSCARHSY